MNIYIATSHSNQIAAHDLAEILRGAEHRVFEFPYFLGQAEPNEPREDLDHSGQYLNRPEWRALTAQHRAALAICDLCVLLLPCGLDSHMAAGMALGMGKRMVVVGDVSHDTRHPFLTWANAILRDPAELLVWLKGQESMAKTHYTQDEIEDYARQTGDPVAAQMMGQLLSLTRIKAMPADERDKKLEVAFKDPTGAASFIAEGFLRMLKNYGAENYLEMSFQSGDGQELILTAHKPRGITAGQGIAQIKTALFDWYFKNSAPPSVSRSGKLYKSMDEIPIQVVIQEVKTLVERRAQFLEKAHQLLDTGALHRDVIDRCASAEDAILVAIKNKGHRRAQKAEGELERLKNFMVSSLMPEIRRGIKREHGFQDPGDDLNQIMTQAMRSIRILIEDCESNAKVATCWLQSVGRQQ